MDRIEKRHERKAARMAQKRMQAELNQFYEEHEDRIHAIAKGFASAVDGEKALVVIAAAASLVFNIIMQAPNEDARSEVHRAAVCLLAGMLNCAHDQLDDCEDEEGRDARH